VGQTTVRPGEGDLRKTEHKKNGKADKKLGGGIGENGGVGTNLEKKEGKKKEGGSRGIESR